MVLIGSFRYDVSVMILLRINIHSKNLQSKVLSVTIHIDSLHRRHLLIECATSKECAVLQISCTPLHSAL